MRAPFRRPHVPTRCVPRHRASGLRSDGLGRDPGCRSARCSTPARKRRGLASEARARTLECRRDWIPEGLGHELFRELGFRFVLAWQLASPKMLAEGDLQLLAGEKQVLAIR